MGTRLAPPDPAKVDASSSLPFFLEGRGLRKEYAGVLAVDDVDIGIRPGEVLGLVGKNGAGKSTTIKMFAGAVVPDSGEIWLDGKPVHLRRPHDARELGLSFVHQELANVPNLTVAENVMLGLGYPRRFAAFVHARKLHESARKVLDRIDASIPVDALARDLSVVQQRLLTIAHALARRSRLLVLDEPSASLTKDEIDHLFSVIRSLASEGVAVVYVSHRLEEIFEITQRVVVMRDARIVADVATPDIDRRDLVSLITGSGGGQTALERRRVRSVGSAEPLRAGEPLLRVEGVALPGAAGTISFELAEGELLGVAGLVGAGRTELVRLIAGADRRTQGKVFVHGREVAATGPTAAHAAGIVLVPEERRSQGLVREFSVRKNITLATLPEHRLARLVPSPSRTRERETTWEMVERLSIRVSGPEQPVDWLSGGNQQKVVLAKWLRHGGEVFMLDEPTLGIDVEAKDEIYDLMEALAADGKGVIFISSEFAELVAVCTRIIVLREGRLVGELRADEVSETSILDLCYQTQPSVPDRD